MASPLWRKGRGTPCTNSVVDRGRACTASLSLMTCAADAAWVTSARLGERLGLCPASLPDRDDCRCAQSLMPTLTTRQLLWSTGGATSAVAVTLLMELLHHRRVSSSAASMQQHQILLQGWGPAAAQPHLVAVNVEEAPICLSHDNHLHAADSPRSASGTTTGGCCAQAREGVDSELTNHPLTGCCIWCFGDSAVQVQPCMEIA